MTIAPVPGWEGDPTPAALEPLGWLHDLDVARRSARHGGQGVPAGEGPRYADLAPEVRASADRRLAGAVLRMVNDLGALGADALWDVGTFAAACRVLRTVAAAWASDDPAAATAEAREVFLQQAPTDATWGRRQHEQKWDSAVNAITRDGVTPLRPSTFGGALPTNPDGTEPGREQLPRLAPAGDEGTSTPGALSPEAAERLRWLLADREARAELARLDAPPVALADHLVVGGDVEGIEPSAPLVRGVMPRGAVVFLSGPSGVGKSTLALYLARAVAAGRPWHGHDAEQGRVLVVSAEGKGGLGGRSRAVTATHGVPAPGPAFAVLPHAPDLSDRRQADELADLARAHRADLVVLDTLNATAGALDENNAGDVGVYVARARALVAEQGGTVVVVHHVGLTDKDRMRGSSALYGAADVVLHIKGTPDEWTLRVTKDKDGPTRDLGTFRTVAAHGAVVTERLPDGRGPVFDSDRDVVDAVRRHLAEHAGDSKGRLVAALRGGHPRNAVDRALKSMIARREVEVRQVNGSNAEHLYLADRPAGATL